MATMSRDENIIDIEFNVFSDTPTGKDPDSFSPTLRQYHQFLWSKNLPSGSKFDLDLNYPRLLHHNSELGEYFLSSDAIGHTFKGVKRMAHIVSQIPSRELESFFHLCTTIGGFIIFPSKQIDQKVTINAARGMNHSIQDRFDLTLECIRRHYLRQESPISATLKRYSNFFDLFTNFEEYTDFFLLQDLVYGNDTGIKFWHPFENFDNSPLPHNLVEYENFKKNVVTFIKARNYRISLFSKNH
jgi:hypothetical protein